MLKKVVHDGTLIEKEENILAREREQNYYGYKHIIRDTLPRVLMQNSLDGALRWILLLGSRSFRV